MSSSDLGPQLREILLESGRPMKRSELLEAIHLRGLTLAGSDPGKYLGTILWRMREAFINIPGYGYWLKDMPSRVADYRPDSEVMQIPLMRDLSVES